jgi:hypothetical protein
MLSKYCWLTSHHLKWRKVPRGPDLNRWELLWPGLLKDIRHSLETNGHLQGHWQIRGSDPRDLGLRRGPLIHNREHRPFQRSSGDGSLVNTTLKNENPLKGLLGTLPDKS